MRQTKQNKKNKTLRRGGTRKSGSTARSKRAAARSERASRASVAKAKSHNVTIHFIQKLIDAGYERIYPRHIYNINISPNENIETIINNKFEQLLAEKMKIVEPFKSNYKIIDTQIKDSNYYVYFSNY
jgi:hypothetical protein